MKKDLQSDSKDLQITLYSVIYECKQETTTAQKSSGRPAQNAATPPQKMVSREPNPDHLDTNTECGKNQGENEHDDLHLYFFPQSCIIKLHKLLRSE